MGPYGRMGVDGTVPLGIPSLLVGLYGRLGRRIHAQTSASLPADPDYSPGHCCEVFPSQGPQLAVHQTELRLSAPLGVAFRVGGSEPRRTATRLVFGLVPSFAVWATDRTSECTDHCEPGLQATAYEEDYTLAFSTRLEWGATD
jgi:hypothetical protein